MAKSWYIKLKSKSSLHILLLHLSHDRYHHLKLPLFKHCFWAYLSAAFGLIWALFLGLFEHSLWAYLNAVFGLIWVLFLGLFERCWWAYLSAVFGLTVKPLKTATPQGMKNGCLIEVKKRCRSVFLSFWSVVEAVYKRCRSGVIFGLLKRCRRVVKVFWKCCRNVVDAL